MIIGDKNTFAIESGITKAYEGQHFRALGFFVIYVAGFCYGIRSPEATMMGASYGAVKNRINRRGTHAARFAKAEAGAIAEAFRNAIYVDGQEQKLFFGIPQPDFQKLIYDNNLMWIPDGDEAFDDSSYILQFDVENRVRLIAFRLGPNRDDYHHDPDTLRDVWLSVDDFYNVLEQWQKGFEKEWLAASKVV